MLRPTNSPGQKMADENNHLVFSFFLNKTRFTPPLHNVQTLHHTLVVLEH